MVRRDRTFTSGGTQMRCRRFGLSACGACRTARQSKAHSGEQDSNGYGLFRDATSDWSLTAQILGRWLKSGLVVGAGVLRGRQSGGRPGGPPDGAGLSYGEVHLRARMVSVDKAQNHVGVECANLCVNFGRATRVSFKSVAPTSCKRLSGRDSEILTSKDANTESVFRLQA